MVFCRINRTKAQKTLLSLLHCYHLLKILITYADRPESVLRIANAGGTALHNSLNL